MDSSLLAAVLILIFVLGVALIMTMRQTKSGTPNTTNEAAQATKLTGKPEQPTEIDVTKAARELEAHLEELPQPYDAVDNKAFAEVVDALCSDRFSADYVYNLCVGTNWVLRCMALIALERRGDTDKALQATRSRLTGSWLFPLVFSLRFVDRNSSQPEIANFLAATQHWWSQNPMVTDELNAIFRRRLAADEPLQLSPSFDTLDADELTAVSSFVSTLAEDVRLPIGEAVKRFSDAAVDTEFLRSIGELVTSNQDSASVFETESLNSLHHQLMDELADAKPQSLLVVGEPGVGKTALRDLFANTLLSQKWRIVKTSPTHIIADQKYIGEIEGQVRRIAKEATARKRVAIFVDRFNELDEFGRHKGKKSSLLDQLWPLIENRSLFFVSETTPSGLQAIATRFPSLSTTVKVLKMEAASESDTAELVTSLLNVMLPNTTNEQVDDVLQEALQVSQQYFSHRALPGSVLSLVRLSAQIATRDSNGQIHRGHVLDALSQISGLPHDVLDEKQTLDVDGLRESFKTRIFGQDEAVDCLVDRIAMLKAGLTDPGRPVGVFLFAGPTGTGKTEIAKTLAEYLFGTKDQMIRLDMSEYQSPDSALRLISDDDESGGSGALTTRIRERPFAVVLLDEFEKAHSKVWDMFLQVFDDGRLSDAKGRLADFRHSIIILTSNLGSTISNEAGIGFTGRSGEFSSNDVMRMVNKTFRREFVNRLDRTVVFKPLNREVMRGILRKELQLVLDRRGLRSKQWAVEWEDSAIEFLLDEGFTPDLGARPLRRAIEQHLLVPLSLTMVQNQAPAGEQFLFVRSDGDALQVEFIDPDATSTQATVYAEATDVSLASILQSATPPKDAAVFLRQTIDTLQSRVAESIWTQNKTDMLSELNSADFWQRDGRHWTLDRIELMDRIESAAATLGKLSDRLSRPTSVLISSIANRLFVLTEGLKDYDQRRATQALIGIRLVTEDTALDNASSFLDDVTQMYRQWARARGMRIETLDSSGCRYQTVFRVSGFGSFGLLAGETGLHVLQTPITENKTERVRVRVQVSPLHTDNGGHDDDAGRTVGTLIDAHAPDKVVVVRRYARAPSPLARDNVNGWRTGRLDFVLAGNFDVLSP